jgi:hypothetical protein
MNLNATKMPGRPLNGGLVEAGGSQGRDGQ